MIIFGEDNILNNDDDMQVVNKTTALAAHHASTNFAKLCLKRISTRWYINFATKRANALNKENQLYDVIIIDDQDYIAARSDVIITSDDEVTQDNLDCYLQSARDEDKSNTNSPSPPNTQKCHGPDIMDYDNNGYLIINNQEDEDS